MNKKLLILLLCALIASSCISLFANDTWFYMAGGQLVPVAESSVNIEMQEEIIDLKLQERTYQVTVDFYFYNFGETVTLNVGFPYFTGGTYGEGEIRNFKCWTNGVETDYSNCPITKSWAQDNWLENAYIREITFPAGEITTTRITYEADCGRESPSYTIFSYLYGTGQSWKNSIGKITLRFTNEALYRRPCFIRMAGVSTRDCFHRIADNTFEAVFYDVEPESYTSTIEITMDDILGNDGPMVLSMDKFIGCKGRISQEWLFWYTKEQLRYLRNAIYAFHGYQFKSQDLQTYFNDQRKHWYPKVVDNPNFSESELSEDELYNIRLILREEQKRQE